MKNDESETVEPVKTRLDRMAMANRIIDTRNMLGMSTYKLCKLLVLDRNSITRLERGEGGCSIETLAGLARVFGCTTDWLLGLSQDGAPTAKK